MQHRTIDNFNHMLRAGRDSVAPHEDLRQLYDEAIEKMRLLADGLYKKQRAQVDEEAF